MPSPEYTPPRPEEFGTKKIRKKKKTEPSKFDSPDNTSNPSKEALSPPSEKETESIILTEADIAKEGDNNDDTITLEKEYIFHDPDELGVQEHVTRPPLLPQEKERQIEARRNELPIPDNAPPKKLKEIAKSYVQEGKETPLTKQELSALRKEINDIALQTIHKGIKNGKNTKSGIAEMKKILETATFEFNND